MKTVERSQYRHSNVFILNFEHISHRFQVILIFNLEHVTVFWEATCKSSQANNQAR